MKNAVYLVALLGALPSFAEDARQLDAHEHGVGALNIAIDGTTVAMEFHAPGADIVGFEYAAESNADLGAIEAAIATLNAPLDLFVMPDAANCSVTKAEVELDREDDHHDDEEHHEDHEEAHHEGHDKEHHDEHAKHDHDGHHDHDEEHHADHADAAGHTEFHAEYTLTCDDTDAVTTIEFAYFETFANAKEVEVQMITASGAQAFEVERDAPVLDLER